MHTGWAFGRFLKIRREGENMLPERYDSLVVGKLSKTVENLQDERKALLETEQRLKVAQKLARTGYWERDLKGRSLK
jgi:hypothetical protein